jgi:O-glycosyl hydrolase
MMFFEELEHRRMFSVNVTVNATQTFQQIDGFGTATAWWETSPYNEAGWTNMYYQDLGASMMRVDLNINALRGSDDNLTTPVTMVDDINTNIAQFDFHRATAGQNIGDVVAASKTQKLDDFKLIGSIWTPPNWMKGPELNPTTGKPDGNLPHMGGPLGIDSLGGTLIDTPANLQQFGRYVAAYVKGYQEAYGVPFYAISIQNELAFTEQYNSCVYTPQIYVDALKAVASAFREYGITTKIEGPEDVGVGSSTDQTILNRQMAYINAVRADPEAMADLGIYSIHGYSSDGASSSRSPTQWAKYWSDIQADGKHSWMTETSGESQTTGGALLVAEKIQDALVEGNVSAWIYWQTGYQGANTTGVLTNDTDTTAPKYNAVKHFFKYIRPGSQRIAATPTDPNGVYASAFRNDANQTITVELVNAGATAQTVNLSTVGATMSSFSTVNLTDATTYWENLSGINFANGLASVSLPAKSVMTLQGLFASPVATSAIAGSVFNDSNGNGKKDGTEGIIAGREIYLDMDNSGTLTAGDIKTFTGTGGGYFFGNLPAGTYHVREVIPSGWQQTLPAKGTALTINLGANQDMITANFATSQLISVSGSVFNDINGDGKRATSTDKGIGAWTVFIDSNNDGKLDNGELFATSDTSGNWTIKNILAGTRTLRIVQKTGFKATTPAGGKTSLTLTGGVNRTGFLFGEKKS